MFNEPRERVTLSMFFHFSTALVAGRKILFPRCDPVPGQANSKRNQSKYQHLVRISQLKNLCKHVVKTGHIIHAILKYLNKNKK